MIRRILQASVYGKDTIPVEDWEDRWDLRVWLPLWDLVLMGAGVWATAFGSPILHRLFPEGAIDAAGMALTIAATVCLMGVWFPVLMGVEFFGKLAVMFLLAAYATCVLLFRQNPADMSSGFVVFILSAAIIPAPSRLMKIGEKWATRRALKKAAAEAAAARTGAIDGLL